MRRNPATRAILTGGLIAGALDITYAIVISTMRGRTPMAVLQSVASGLLGRDAYQGGVPVAALGLFLHFCIALIWASIFWAASRQLLVLTRKPVPSGILYGVFVYAMMNLVVIPLSRVPPRTAPMATVVLVTGLLIHMFGIGLPIALAASRATLPED